MRAKCVRVKQQRVYATVEMCVALEVHISSQRRKPVIKFVLNMSVGARVFLLSGIHHGRTIVPAWAGDALDAFTGQRATSSRCCYHSRRCCYGVGGFVPLFVGRSRRRVPSPVDTRLPYWSGSGGAVHSWHDLSLASRALDGRCGARNTRSGLGWVHSRYCGRRGVGETVGSTPS